MIRLTDRDQERLAKLRRILVDLDQTAITRRAWAHLLATLERREPVHLTVPSEEAEQEQGAGRSRPESGT